MISKTVAVSTLFAMYIFTMFFIAAIPQETMQTAGNETVETSMVK
ncbi:hypothetical protein [Oryzifoliimicrobium ureilyticus]